MALLNIWTLVSYILVIFSSQLWLKMPQWYWGIPCVALLIISIRVKKLHYLLGPTIACLVILAHGNILRHQTVELFTAGLNITINAEADSFFKSTRHGFKGIVVIKAINGQKLGSYEWPKIWLQSPMPLKFGQTITCKVKLKPIVGQLNEVGFDQEAYAYSREIIASANVDIKSSYYLEDYASLRQFVYQTISEKIENFTHQGLIKALLFGVRHEISPQMKAKLQYSGLSHLIAISGLHIGIVFSFGWFMARLVSSISSYISYLPVVLGGLCAFSYAYLAGFSIPTTRALLMCLLMCVLLFSQVELTLLHKWLLILAVMLTIWPNSLLDSSLWLSMYAVGMILLFLSLRLRIKSKILTSIFLQLFIVITMIIPIAMLFGGLSIASIGYNLVAVPWFSLVVIPMTFLAALTEFIPIDNTILWLLVDSSLLVIVALIKSAEMMWFPISSFITQFLLFFILMVAGGLVLSHHGFITITMMMLILLISWREKVDWQINVLDVGHGLAVLIVHQEKALLYDTGASWQQSNYVQQLITPLLEAKGITQLDILVLSHFDNDHAGGWQSVIERWSPPYIIASQSINNGISCVAGAQWRWGDIQLQALWPPKVVKRAYNSHSCVVKLTHRMTQTSVLLTGDTEKIAEWLLVRDSQTLDSDIILVPHHGSNTSSLPIFVDAVSPQLAIASTAYQGRWNLPSQKVIKRYKQQGARWLDTGSSGQVVIDFYSHNYQIETLRSSKGNAWYRQMLRNRVE